MNKPKAIIIDLEGTITDCSHRLHHLDNEDYDKWTEEFKNDKPNWELINELKESIAPEFLLIIHSAKNVIEEPSVCNWLLKYGLKDMFPILKMRKLHDNRRSVEVKRDMLRDALSYYEILGVYDDRVENCNMYEEFKTISVHLVTPTEIKIKTPSDILIDLAELFDSRNGEYGNSYKQFGPIMKEFFPDGVELKTAKDFGRFAIVVMKVAKMHRYSLNFNKGGHKDSLDDLCVYSAMLNHIDQEVKDV